MIEGNPIDHFILPLEVFVIWRVTQECADENYRGKSLGGRSWLIDENRSFF
jgi:hypothetical protein